MLLLLGGVAILCGLLLLVYLFINADPARLARAMKWLGIGLAVLLLGALAISGRLFFLLGPLAILFPLLRRLGPFWKGFRRPSAGRVSTVESAYLRMVLDHDTGTMSGTVLKGEFAGMRLEELGPADRLGLLRELRAGDEEGARLLEAYLDRLDPQWRGDLGSNRDSGGADTGPRGSPGSDTLGVEEAYAILGLAPGATTDAIKEAHRRLMKQLHPDHGGSDYFAAKINRARDLLLGR